MLSRCAVLRCLDAASSIRRTRAAVKRVLAGLCRADYTHAQRGWRLIPRPVPCPSSGCNQRLPDAYTNKDARQGFIRTARAAMARWRSSCWAKRGSMEDLLGELLGAILEPILEPIFEGLLWLRLLPFRGLWWLLRLSIRGVITLVQRPGRSTSPGPQDTLPGQLPPRRRSHWERRYPQRPSPKQQARLLKQGTPEPPAAD
jgi:hypothetical protein